MKKKSLKSLSLKKSNVAQISGGAQDQQAQEAISLACPLTTTILTIHTIDPWRCPTMSCNSICEWCKTIG
jgi:hypothetical protein